MIMNFTVISFADDLDNEEVVDVSAEILASSTNLQSNSKIPQLNSRACVVIDRNTNTILYGKNENTKRKMASTTKIMTAIIILENCNLTDVVEISKKAAGTGGSRLGLHTGDKITVNDLLYGLLLCSGNDAAVALAEYAGNDLNGFAELMNKKAENLCLNNTHFVTPHGLDNDNHYTTAYELALLSNYALNNAIFAKIVSTKNYSVCINGNYKSLNNTNELLGYLNGVYGVKTGFTNGANRCLVTATKRNNLDIICVVLGADTKKDRTRDSINLIEYVFSNFEMIDIENIIKNEFENWKNSNQYKFQIIKGKSNTVNVQLSDIPYNKFPVNSIYKDDISININTDYTFSAPLYKDSIIGTLDFIINNNVIFTLNIYNTDTIEKKDIYFYFSDLFTNYIMYLENF